MGPNRTCPFHVFSVFPDLHVFARFGRYSGFHCISMGISLHIHGIGPNVPVPRFLRFPRTYTFSPVLAVLGDFTAYPWGFHCISMGPNVPVPRFLRSPRTCTFSPVLAVLAVIIGFPWGIHLIQATKRATSVVAKLHVTTLHGLRHNTWPFLSFLVIMVNCSLSLT